MLKAKRYHIVRKITTAEGQIREMLDFYNLCCLMLTKCFPSEQAKDNFLLLNFLASQENNQEIIIERLTKGFKLLNGYEELENRITAIQMLFCQYQESFPDIYQLYNLEDIAMQQISDIISSSKQFLRDNPSWAEKL